MKNIWIILKTTVILTLVCALAAAGLGYTNYLTKDKIQEAQIKVEKQAMSSIVNADEYVSDTVIFDNVEYTYNRAVVNGETIAYFITRSANGYGGKIKVMVGIGNDGKIIAVKILDAANETPGLGQNVTKKNYYGQYVGKESGVAVTKGDASGNKVLAVTGATISSKAVAEAVNDAFDLYNAVKEAE